MAATDQKYRNQKTLDVIFAVSCVGMLLSAVWMFYDDYAREWKPIQRQFRDVETALNERQMLDQLPEASEVAARQEVVAKARQVFAKAKDSVAADDRRIAAARDLNTAAYQTVKADLDSAKSYYDIAVDDRSKADKTELARLNKEVEHLTHRIHELEDKLEKAQQKLDETEYEYREKVRRPLEEPERNLGNAEDELKKLTSVFDRYAKTTAQKRWKWGDSFRNWPIIDGFASPTRINQIVLNDLTIDYGGFKDVPRNDRCATCHLAIDRALFAKTTLDELTKTPEGLKGKLDTARKLLEERSKSGENLGFSIGDLPGEVRTVDLKSGQVKMFAAHPRLDLFVDANSPHPMEKIGCTICHGGQGSATSFMLASHTPADARQEAEWAKNHEWHSNHFWDFPMLSGRFVESSCLKCHHQVTDLIRYGSKEEAPKLLKGYNLVRENGCFGCHDIAGLKSGRPIGPDLRLEPTPALDLLTPAEQEKAKSDPANPPGVYRKVGPGLRRLAEKTNQEWTRKWLQNPRGFREDTKMPHFYNLGTNSPESLKGTGQEAFPDAEIHSIAYYLLAESKGHLKGEDSTRKGLEDTLDKLLKQLLGEGETKGPLEDKDKKELDAVSRQLADLALLSVPTRSHEINELAAKQKQLQDRLQELLKQQKAQTARKEQLEKQAGDTGKVDEDLANLPKLLAAPTKELPGVVEQLKKAGLPTPISKQVMNWNGKVLEPKSLPAADDKRLAAGKKLFTERGCLACHAHEGTTKGATAVISEANFGPNLSRIAAKLAPEVGDGKSQRLWLVQWLLNPNVHHPRTRMPITQLEVQEAADIADWLLSQTVTDWTEKDPEAPTTETLVRLARLYLAKAPGITQVDLDKFLPEKGESFPGIPPARLASLARDAEEHKLAEGKVNPDNLKWYIAKKSITRLGCFGCHDLPGFEQSKPIGTALNEWGKKDGDRLAFEDGAAFVKEHFNIVESRTDPKDKSKADPEWKADAKGRPPYEALFYEAVKHHTREGFLHLKLAEPRSYDYNRRRTYDDRLRMPQFKFARSRQKKDEEAEDFAIRQEKEEAEAREAVMTFILGLVADPIPAKYLHTPKPDRLAEIKGRQLLDKYNCIGCHQARPGLFEFKPTLGEQGSLTGLDERLDAKMSEISKTHSFPDHNAWVGTPSPYPDRLMAFATQPKVNEDDDPPKTLEIRLADALRYTNADRIQRDAPAGLTVPIPLADLIRRPDGYGNTKIPDSYGGTFGNLLIPYARAISATTIKSDDDARNVLPPPLIREGERVQPNWLFQFLLKPHLIRPQVWLRMPQFNMSPEEAMALVNYFTAVEKLTNPNVGTAGSFLNVDQHDDAYWQKKTEEYVKRLKPEQVTKRFQELKPIWKLALQDQVISLQPELSLARVALKVADEDLKKAPNDNPTKEAQKKADEEVKAIEAKIKALEEQARKEEYKSLEEEWRGKDAYAADAYRLLTTHGSRICLSCHSAGNLGVRNAPALDKLSERLRPDWTARWLASPQRMYPYNPAMPVNFPKDKDPANKEDFFDADSLTQIMAVRDVLLNYPRVANMPVNRYYRPGLAGGK